MQMQSAYSVDFHQSILFRCAVEDARPPYSEALTHSSREDSNLSVYMRSLDC